MVQVSGASQGNGLWPCDIVMAGGVTSGIIYPVAVAEIAKSYSFHSIGGTSVGAIAAIGAAAAEYRRRTEQDPDKKFEVSICSDDCIKSLPRVGVRATAGFSTSSRRSVEKTARRTRVDCLHCSRH